MKLNSPNEKYSFFCLMLIKLWRDFASFENIVGIEPDDKLPGFKKVIIDPLIIPSLLPLSFQHQSIHGDIKVDIKIENKKATMLIDIPNGIMGELRLKKYHNIKVNNITQENKISELNSGIITINFDI